MAIDFKDVRAEPKYPWIKFVDGYSAKILSMRPVKEDGKDMWLVKLIPSQELIKRYELRANEPFIDKTFPFESIVQLSNDPAWTEYFCYYTYDSKDTPATYKFTGFAYIKRIEEYQNENERLKTQLASIKARCETAEANVLEYIRKYSGAVMEQMGPALRGMLIEQLNNPMKSGAGT